MKTPTLSILVAGLVLSGCGGTLSEKDAKAALLAKQKPVEFRKTLLTEYNASNYQDDGGFFDVYGKVGLIEKPGKNLARHGNDLGLDARKIKAKGWDEYVRVNGNQVSVYNFMSRVGEIQRINSDPVDRLCDAVVEYTYEKYDYAPWGKDIEKVQFPTPIVWDACMIKYDNSWGVKDWKKKTTGRRR